MHRLFRSCWFAFGHERSKVRRQAGAMPSNLEPEPLHMLLRRGAGKCRGSQEGRGAEAKISSMDLFPSSCQAGAELDMDHNSRAVPGLVTFSECFFEQLGNMRVLHFCTPPVHNPIHAGGRDTRKSLYVAVVCKVRAGSVAFRFLS